MRNAASGDIHDDLVAEASAGHRRDTTGRIYHGHTLGESDLHITDEILAERVCLSAIRPCHCIGAAGALPVERRARCTGAGRSARMQATATERAVRNGGRDVVHE